MSDILRIKRFNARPVLAPMKMPLRTSSGAVDKAPLVLIDCETDQGVIGHSYIFAIMPVALKPLTEMVRAMSELIAGDELIPHDIERKLARAFALLDLAGIQRLAQSGIDMAIWDALARARNLPLARVLGGVPKPIRAYNSKGLGIMPPEAAADEAQRLIAEGCSAAKIRLGRPDANDDLKTVRAVRKAVGDPRDADVRLQSGADRRGRRSARRHARRRRPALDRGADPPRRLRRLRRGRRRDADADPDRREF